jgi:hypothetical protein
VGLKTSDGRQDYDYASLTSCAKRLKNQVPEAADEKAATLTANKDIPYQVIISTIDAIRKADDGQELFPTSTSECPSSHERASRRGRAPKQAAAQKAASLATYKRELRKAIRRSRSSRRSTS